MNYAHLLDQLKKSKEEPAETTEQRLLRIGITMETNMMALHCPVAPA